MEHLSAETLARLVDEEPRLDEAEHLAACEPCRGELEALRDQTAALGGLPEIVPPQGDWRVLEARLRSEGLVQSPTLLQKVGLAHTPQWMRAAASILLFFAGAGTGIAFQNATAEAAEGQLTLAEATDVETAASLVRVAQEDYVSAVSQYRELLARNGGDVGDPISRYAALEHLVSVSQAAVRQAPADPFLNGILASALAERDAMVRLVSASGDNWF